MARDLQRDLLLAKLYSREGSTAAVRDYVDPDSGKVLRLTSYEWDLLQYDRARTTGDESAEHASLTAAAGNGIGSRDAGAQADRMPTDAAEVDGSHADGVAAAGPPRSMPRMAALSRRPGRRGVVIGIALLVVGCLIGAALAVGAARLRPDLFGLTPRPDVPAPTSEIDAVFNSGDFLSADPGALAAIGYRRDSFRLIGDEIVYDRTGQTFAARRDDGAYCLVLVSALVRTAETCASADGIAESGLTMADTTREGDGSLLTFTARWNRNGQITWDLVETSH